MSDKEQVLKIYPRAKLIKGTWGDVDMVYLIVSCIVVR